MNKVFFLDIFDKILKYGEKEVIIVFDKIGNIWFGLRDILKIMEYKNYKKALYNINISDYNKKKYNEINLPKVPFGGTFKKNYTQIQFL